MVDIEELESILKQQVEVYTDMEREVLNKKEFIIKGDITRLQEVDTELEKITHNIQKLEKRKKEVENLLNINQTFDTNRNRIIKFEEDIKAVTKNINRHNKVSMELLKHSLKMVEGSINIILNTATPETSTYNAFGKVKNNHTNTGISSIVQDV